MLVSPEAPPPSADVKSDHRFQAAALIEQQHLPNVGSRRTSYSLYHHNTHESDVYPEFNWETHSNVKLSYSVNAPEPSSENMENKLQNSPDTSTAFEAHCGAASPSPSLSLSDTVNSDGVNGSNDIHAMSLSTSLDFHTKEKNSTQPPTKRPRPPSLSRLDYRSFDRYPYSPSVASANATSTGFGDTSGHLSGESLDLSSLPPILTREESETSDLAKEVKDVLQVTAQFHYRNSDSRVGNTDASEGPSAQRSAHEDSNGLHPSSQLAPFNVGEHAFHPNPAHTTLATPHSAASISFSPQQSDSQSLTFANHTNAYLSTLPSPVVTQSNGQAQSSHRLSYPTSPLTRMSASNSTTYPPALNPPFSPLSPPLDSTSNQSNMVPPSSPALQDSHSPFSPTVTSHFNSTPFRSNGATEETVPPPRSSGQPPEARGTSPCNPATASAWNSLENQAPRRRGKLPSAVTGILKTWLMSHTAHPYPTEEEKKSLCEQTNLSMNQVSNWFINARRRILVPPSAGNSVHEIRQPVRRQGHSQYARATSSASLAPPCLTIRHLSPPSVPPSPSTAMYSPVSASSPNLHSVGSFDFRYPPPHQASHESAFHSGSISGCRAVNSMCSSPDPWRQSTSLVRQIPSSPLYPPHGSHPLSYYSSSQSPYPSYHPHNTSASSTPLPSPIYSYAGCSGPYSTNQPRLNSPRSHPTSHPPTPTVPHSSESLQPPPVAYIPSISCNQSTTHSTASDREE